MSEMTRLEKLQKQQEQIQNRIKAEKAKLSSQNRKARNHALMVLGGMVEQYADWKTIDWDKLAAWLKQYAYKIAECTQEELEPKQAADRLRAWEKKGRERA